MIMTEHQILMMSAQDRYGVTHVSAYVYRTARHSFPTRVVAWSNVNRKNPHPGERKWTDFGSIGGEGKYLDPHNQGTDSEESFLLSPESSVIDAYGTGTGTEASGQVFAEEIIRPGDALVLVFPDGSNVASVAHFTNNGHGVATPTIPV
jgi:hypothetical protein